MENQHTSHAIYAYLDRIGNLISAQEWVLSKRYDLQPVQLRMLYYLSVCNRYSNTPSGVTEYMQLTKGTVSQSLKVLEYKGYIEKQIDAHDRRQVHLLATESGQEVLKQLPPNLLRTVAEELGEAASAETVFILRRLLVAMQRDNRMQGFGVCRTCHYHQALDERYFRCGLTGERLTNQNAGLICREHLEPHTGQRS